MGTPFFGFGCLVNDGDERSSPGVAIAAVIGLSTAGWIAVLLLGLLAVTS